MNKLLLLICSIWLSAQLFASASLKITFSGTNSYMVNVNGSNFFVDDQYLQLDNLNEGNYVLKFSVSHGLKTILVHTTNLYLQDNTETISLFENNVLQVKSINQLNNVVIVTGNNNGWNNPNYFSDADFQAVLKEVENESFDSKKKDKIVSLIKHGKISSSQGVQLLNTFSFDSERYESAVAMVPYIYDQQNLWQLGETFSFQSHKEDYLEYIDQVPANNSGNTYAVSPGISYYMDASSFTQLLNSVKDESFDSNKPALILSSVKHTTVTTNQAIQLLETFDFDSYRLEAAKELTPYISDRHNYWQAGNTFGFSSNKDEFLKYIK